MNYYNCIYMYVNKINGKRYIGQTKDFNKRHKQHIKLHKMIIDRAFDKYGEDNFEIIILAHDVPTQEQLDSYERFFIKRYKTFTSQHGYNVAEGGSNGNPRKDFTEEQLEGWKQKLREANLGKEMSQETKDKISVSATTTNGETITSGFCITGDGINFSLYTRAASCPTAVLSFEA